MAVILPHAVRGDGRTRTYWQDCGLWVCLVENARRLHEAVKSVSLDLHPGETLGVVGESGSGKTTLGKLVLALTKPHHGKILLNGEKWNTALEKIKVDLPRKRDRASAAFEAVKRQLSAGSVPMFLTQFMNTAVEKIGLSWRKN